MKTKACFGHVRAVRTGSMLRTGVVSSAASSVRAPHKIATGSLENCGAARIAGESLWPLNAITGFVPNAGESDLHLAQAEPPIVHNLSDFHRWAVHEFHLEEVALGKFSKVSSTPATATTV